MNLTADNFIGPIDAIFAANRKGGKVHIETQGGAVVARDGSKITPGALVLTVKDGITKHLEVRFTYGLPGNVLTIWRREFKSGDPLLQLVGTAKPGTWVVRRVPPGTPGTLGNTTVNIKNAFFQEIPMKNVFGLDTVTQRLTFDLFGISDTKHIGEWEINP